MNFGFSPEAPFARAVEVKTGLATATGLEPSAAAAKGLGIMAPGGFIKDPISTISFGMALMFGTAGLHHPQGCDRGGALGVILALVLTVLSPSIWVRVLAYAEPLFP